jgi:hypothetical protein
MRGINIIHITGRLLNKSIPIGAAITLVRFTTRIFIMRTIAARVEVGIKASMASALLGFLVLELPAPPFVRMAPRVPVGLPPAAPVRPSMPREAPAPVVLRLAPLARRFKSQAARVPAVLRVAPLVQR